MYLIYATTAILDLSIDEGGKAGRGVGIVVTALLSLIETSGASSGACIT